MQPSYHRFSDEELDEFAELYKEECGQELSRKEASEIAFRLLTFYELLARKLPNEHNAPPHAAQRDDDHGPIGFRTSGTAV
jgi:hypothetical protein